MTRLALADASAAPAVAQAQPGDAAPFLERRSRTLIAWARTFRYPASWYDQSEENRAIARAVREDAGRQISAGVRRAVAQARSGDVAAASATLAGLELYAHTLQQVRSRLEDDRSTVSVWVENAQLDALHALEAAARGVSNLGSGITSTAAMFAIGALALWAILR